MIPTRRTLGLFAAASVVASMAPVAAQRAPAQERTNLPPEVLSLACAPSVAFSIPASPLRITGGQDTLVRMTHSPGDLITINAGRLHGIEVGQEFYARRLVVSERARISRETPATVQTVGWIRVYAVDDAMSLATITHPCDSINVGDYLEPFVLPIPPAASANRSLPDRNNYGRAMRGVDGRVTFGKGDYFIVNRGSADGVTPGAQFVLYRDKKQEQNFLYELGEAVAVEVRAESATLQVTMARDAIMEGDHVAQRR